MNATPPHQFRFDLLRVRLIRSVLRWPLFPVALQVVALGALVALAVNGWGLGTDRPAKDLAWLRKTNLTTLLVWGFWWPGLIVATVLFGRVWCTVCPTELVNRMGDALARRVGWPRLRMGRWLRAGWLVVLAWMALQVVGAGFPLSSVPHYTALMLVTLLALGLVTGLIFRDSHSFCRSFCPAAAMLSVYGRFTPLQNDVRDPDVCARCGTRDCVDQANRYKLDGRSCPSLLQPFARAQSDGCVLCLQCAKVCPQDNIGFGLAEPTAGSRQHRLLEPFEALFVMVASGLVTSEVMGEVPWLAEIFRAVPKAVQQHVAPSVAFGWFNAAWFLGLFPLVLWAVVAAVARLLGCRQSLKTLLLAAATGAAPIVALAQIAKAVSKTASFGGYLPMALADPAGFGTLGQLAAKTLAPPGNWASLSALGWVLLFLLGWVAWRSVRWTQDASGEHRKAAFAGLGVATVLYAGMLGVWAGS
jgi:polyferredoxin